MEFIGQPSFNYFCDKRAFSLLKKFLLRFSTLLISVVCMFRLSSGLAERVLKAGCFMMQSYLSKIFYNITEMFV